MKQLIFIILILCSVQLLAQKDLEYLSYFPALKEYSSAFVKPQSDSAVLLYFDYKDKSQKLPYDFLSQCRLDSVLLQAEIDTLYALGRIVTDDYTLYLTKYDGGNYTMWNSIYMYMFSPKTCTEIRVDLFWGAEGGEGYSKSWVLDYNGDGKADLLLKNSMELQTYNENMDFKTDIDYHLLVWNIDKWVEIKIEDIEKLKRQFKIK